MGSPALSELEHPRHVRRRMSPEPIHHEELPHREPLEAPPQTAGVGPKPCLVALAVKVVGLDDERIAPKDSSVSVIFCFSTLFHYNV